jgi:1-acyl-sn-glycerol-3-phosphate acyltransferase
MTSRETDRLRILGRLLWLCAELVLAAIDYATHCAFCCSASLPKARAEWLQHAARRILRVLRVHTRCQNSAPISGLLVCNHLSYLDVLVLAALAPSRFVAKSEVKHWPVFGWFARLAGTIFVNRNKPLHSGQTAEEIGVAISQGVVVVLFPEGTSSGGQTVLPFKSSLLEPATRDHHAVTAGCLTYELADGNVSEEVCYWKDMTLVPHLINLLGKRRIYATVSFSKLRSGSANRKELARQLRSEVLKLKEALA